MLQIIFEHLVQLCFGNDFNITNTEDSALCKRINVDNGSIFDNKFDQVFNRRLELQPTTASLGPSRVSTNQSLSTSATYQSKVTKSSSIDASLLSTPHISPTQSSITVNSTTKKQQMASKLPIYMPIYPPKPPLLGPPTPGLPWVPPCKFTGSCCALALGQLPADIEFAESALPGTLLAEMKDVTNITMNVNVEPTKFQALFDGVFNVTSEGNSTLLVPPRHVMGELSLSPGTLRAVDGDMTSQNNISYSVMHSEPDDYDVYFHVDEETGRVNKTRKMNSTDPNKYVIFVKAMEDSPQQQSRVAIVSIVVIAPSDPNTDPQSSVNPIVRLVLQIATVFILMAFIVGCVVIFHHRYQVHHSKVKVKDMPSNDNNAKVQFAVYQSSNSSLNTTIPDNPASPSQVTLDNDHLTVP
ncbi:CAD99-like protein [Mya arenaria]|uniref:CAD99-like protein n=1 Tax=Mya arenaria TaxID=6604 RepID=A0ABY7D8M3_MYAAR|nr:CAD99-like protein [Mya arenaria]